MASTLPNRPSLRHLKNQAKELLAQLRRDRASARLADAQRLIARQYGFADWRMLRAHVEQMSGQRLVDLAATFRRFASQECRGSSPSYECWANHVADDEEILRIAAFGRTPVPNLFFAALHLLVLENPACEVARHYASVDSAPLPAAAGWPRVRAFCLEHRHALVRLMRSRTTQTNEVRRNGYLAAAFNVVWKRGGRKPLGLVEIGASAGLNLCFDHFAFRVSGRTFGNSSLVLDVESRGASLPPIPRKPFPIRHRIGLDLRPITAGDADGVRWLNALVWPEHGNRRSELAEALRIAAKVSRQLVAGDAVLTMDEVLRGISPDCTLCVFQTHAFNQIPAEGREKILGCIRNAAERRPVSFVSRHDRLTLQCFDSKGGPPPITLAETDAHGRWIDWSGPVE